MASLERPDGSLRTLVTVPHVSGRGGHRCPAKGALGVPESLGIDRWTLHPRKVPLGRTCIPDASTVLLGHQRSSDFVSPGLAGKTSRLGVEQKAKKQLNNGRTLGPFDHFSTRFQSSANLWIVIFRDVVAVALVGHSNCVLLMQWRMVCMEAPPKNIPLGMHTFHEAD